MPDNSFEKQVQELMRGLELTPEETVWANLQKELQPEKRRRRFAFWWWLPLAALIAGSAWFWLDKKETARSATQKNILTTHTDSASAPIKEKTAGNTASPGTLPVTSAASAQPPVKHTETAVNRDIAVAMLSPGTSYSPHQPVAQEPVTGQQPVETVPGTEEQAALRSTIKPLAPPDDHIASTSFDHQQTLVPAYLYTPAPQLITPALPIVPLSPAKTPVPAKDTVWPVVTAAKKNSSNSKWHLLPFAQAGVVQLVSGISLKAPSSGPSSDFNGSMPGGGVYAYSRVYTEQDTKNGFSLKAGLAAEKKLDARWRMQVGLYYAFTSLNQDGNTYKDSINTGANYRSLRNLQQSNTTLFHLHSVGLQLSWHYRLLKQAGISAGLANDVYIASQKRKTVNVPPGVVNNALNGYSITTVSSVQSQVNAYVPSFYLSLDFPIIQQQKHEWWISPYLQYGAARTFKADADMQKKYLWQLGINLSRHIR